MKQRCTERKEQGTLKSTPKSGEKKKTKVLRNNPLQFFILKHFLRKLLGTLEIRLQTGNYFVNWSSYGEYMGITEVIQKGLFVLNMVYIANLCFICV